MIFKTFGLKSHPFSEGITTKDIYLDARFKASLDTLKMLPDIGDIAVLTGRTGTGKTTLLQQLMEIWRIHYDVYYIHLGNLKGSGLFRTLLTTLGERPRLGKDRMFDQLYSCISKKQRCLCLLIDEAQLMDISAMTDLRLLGGNLDLRGRLKLVLSGQPLMIRTLQVDSLTDLRERVVLNIQLKAMTLPETHAYIEHRLERAGAQKQIFDDASVKLMYHHSEGVPRRVNRVALKAIMNAWQKGMTEIDDITTREACEADQS
jgi:general secretion pathway protein A